MSRILKALGRNRDIPQLETYGGSSASAGTGSDFEHVIAHIPNLAINASAGTVGDMPSNIMVVRYAALIFEAAITGAATNNATFNFWQRRGGALLVATTASTTVSAAGQATITPVSMANIAVGVPLAITGGTGTAETVYPTAISATTFTATFVNTHSGTYNIGSVPLATITFASGTNAAAYAPISFSVPRNTNTLLPNDVVTIARVSAGTGLATPAYAATIDWVPAGAA